MPEEPSDQKMAPSQCRGGRFFGSRKRHVWYAREGYEGANSVQSPKLVDWGLTRYSIHLNSYHMTHVLKNIVNQWQILVHLSSFVTPVWRLLLGQFGRETTRRRCTDGQHGNAREPNLGPSNVI